MMIRKRYVGAIAALWTACAFAAPQEIIAINFGADQQSLGSGSEELGFESGEKGGTTALDTWNNMNGGNGSWAVKGTSGNRYALEWSALGTYWSGSSDTETGKLTKGYLDNSSGKQVSITL